MNWTEIGKKGKTSHFTLGRLLEEGQDMALFEAEISEQVLEQKRQNFGGDGDRILVQLSLPQSTPVTRIQNKFLLCGETHDDLISIGNTSLNATIYTYTGKRLDEILAVEKWSIQTLQANLTSMLLALGQLHALWLSAGKISPSRFIHSMDHGWCVLGSASAAADLQCPFLCHDDMEQLGTLLITLAETHGQDTTPEAATFFERLSLIGMDCSTGRQNAPRTAADAATLICGETIPPAPVYQVRTQGTAGLTLRRKDERQPGGLLLADLTTAQLDLLQGVCIPRHDLRLIDRSRLANQEGDMFFPYTPGQWHLVPYAVKGTWARLGRAMSLSSVADVSGLTRYPLRNNSWALRWDWPADIKNVEIIITRTNARKEQNRLRTLKYQFHRYAEQGCCILTAEECGEHGSIQVLAAEPLGKGAWKLSSGLPEDCRITY